MLKIQSGSFLSCHNFQKTQRKAFSVAEVLITLGVIGVIASIVLPMVKLKYQEITTVAKVRKVYALLNKGYEASIQRFGPVRYWALEGEKAFGSYKFVDYLIPEGLKVDTLKNLPEVEQYDLTGSVYGMKESPQYRLQDGTMIFGVWVSDKNCGSNNYFSDDAFTNSVCGDISIDIDGITKKNRLGIDQFQFRIVKNGVIPMGHKSDKVRSINEFCNPKKPQLFNGYGCTAWIIEKGTMPWLYGKQVNWD